MIYYQIKSNPTPVKPEVAEQLKLKKGTLKSSVMLNEHVGLEARSYNTYDDQHKHGSHKHSYAAFDKPIVHHITEKVNEVTEDRIVINGIHMSSEQAIKWKNGKL